MRPVMATHSASPRSCPILTRSYEPAFPPEWEGLDLVSAEEATPRWYGVSSGDGNNGVSHMFPDYYVRTCEPYTLAAAATLSEFKPKWHDNVAENMQIDGEAEFTIQACIYEPEDVDPSEAPEPVFEHVYRCSECNATWEGTSTVDVCVEDCPECGCDCDPIESVEQERDPDDLYSAANGAFFLLDVFLVDGETIENTSRMKYESLDATFSADIIGKAREA